MFIIYNGERAADGRGRGAGGGEFHRLRVRVDGGADEARDFCSRSRW